MPVSDLAANLFGNSRIPLGGFAPIQSAQQQEKHLKEDDDTDDDVITDAADPNAPSSATSSLQHPTLERPKMTKRAPSSFPVPVPGREEDHDIDGDEDDDDKMDMNTALLTPKRPGVAASGAHGKLTPTTPVTPSADLEYQVRLLLTDADRSRDEISRLEVAVRQKENELQAARYEHSLGSPERMEGAAKVERAQGELDRQRKEVARLELALNDVHDREVKLKQENMLLKADVDVLTRENTSLRKEAKATESRLASLDSIEAALRSTKEELAESKSNEFRLLSDVQTSRKEHSAAVVQAQAKSREVNQALQAASSRVQTAEHEMAELSSRLEKSQAELAARLGDLKAQLGEKTAAVESLQETVEQLSDVEEKLHFFRDLVASWLSMTSCPHASSLDEFLEQGLHLCCSSCSSLAKPTERAENSVDPSATVELNESSIPTSSSVPLIEPTDVEVSLGPPSVEAASVATPSVETSVAALSTSSADPKVDSNVSVSPPTSSTPSPSPPATHSIDPKTLGAWCRGFVGSKVTITNFTSSWKDGKAFAALIDGLTGKLDYNHSISSLTAPQLLDRCFRVAEVELKVPKTLLSSQVSTEPDRDAVVEYLTLLHAASGSRDPPGSDKIPVKPAASPASKPKVNTPSQVRPKAASTSSTATRSPAKPVTSRSTPPPKARTPEPAVMSRRAPVSTSQTTPTRAPVDAPSGLKQGPSSSTKAGTSGTSSTRAAEQRPKSATTARTRAETPAKGPSVVPSKAVRTGTPPASSLGAKKPVPTSKSNLSKIKSTTASTVSPKAVGPETTASKQRAFPKTVAIVAVTASPASADPPSSKPLAALARVTTPVAEVHVVVTTPVSKTPVVVLPAVTTPKQSLESVPATKPLESRQGVTPDATWVTPSKASMGVTSSPGSPSGVNALLQWCAGHTQFAADVEVRNFTQSWANGRAFAALVDSISNGKFGYAMLSEEDKALNGGEDLMQRAFDFAELNLGVPRLLDAEDIVGCQDKNSIVAYLLEIHKAAHGHSRKAW